MGNPCRMSPSCLAGLAIVVVEDHDDARRACLPKPFTPDKLVDTILSVLQI